MIDDYINHIGLKKICDLILNKTAKKVTLDEHVGNKSNPHGVTKSQVGLGNVPNVSTNNQTPTYTTVETLAKLVTGEKLGVALGKIAKAVDELITHLADNVKHVTAEERTSWNGKAAGNHTHTASEVGALTNIKIGTVTTGAAGSSAAASASTSGTVTTLNLTIPKGDKGDKGDTGAKGATGNTGATGAQGEKGDTGAKGATGATGTRGSRWNTGTVMTGTTSLAIAYKNSGITDALVNDMYLNTSTGNIYRCTVGGTADVAKWLYAGSIKGDTGIIAHITQTIPMKSAITYDNVISVEIPTCNYVIVYIAITSYSQKRPTDTYICEIPLTGTNTVFYLRTTGTFLQCLKSNSVSSSATGLYMNYLRSARRFDITAGTAGTSAQPASNGAACVADTDTSITIHMICL